MLAVASASSSNRACSGLVTVRVGGAGALRLFDRRFRNSNGPIPVAEMQNKPNFEQLKFKNRPLSLGWKIKKTNVLRNRLPDDDDDCCGDVTPVD